MSKVSIHLYDLSNGMARSMSLRFIGRQIEGIWHTGVVVYGKEYYYGGGICNDAPGRTPYGNPVKTIPIGETEIPEDLFLEFLQEINPKFSADKYDLFENNCNNFSDACCEFLTGQPMPSYITGLPKEVLATPMGKMLKPMIDGMQKNMMQNSHPMFGQNGTAPPLSNPMSNPSYASPSTGGGKPMAAVISITNPEEFNQVIRSSKAVIVDFFSYTCPPCMQIKPFYERLAADYQVRCPDVKFVSVDTGVARSIASAYQISSIPTFIGFLNGAVHKRFKGANQKELENLAEALAFKVNNAGGGLATVSTGPETPSFKLFDPTKKDFYTFSAVNYANPIKNINTILEGFPSLNQPDAKEIFTRFSADPEGSMKSFSKEDKTYLINWIFETIFYIEISDKTIGFLDLLRVLSLDNSFLELVYSNEDKLYQIMKFFEKPESTLKELPKGLKLILLRFMTNLTAADKHSKIFFQHNLGKFIELMVKAGNIYREDKASLHPIIMGLWNLVQNFGETKEFKENAGTVAGFARTVFNETVENDILLGVLLMSCWLSLKNKEIAKETAGKVDKAKLAKLEFSENETVGKLSRDLSDILESSGGDGEMVCIGDKCFIK